MAARKPFVVALGDPKYVGQEFLNEFKKDFDFEVLLSPFFAMAESPHATDTACHKSQGDARSSTPTHRQTRPSLCIHHPHGDTAI
jgi:hypothetical protein